MPHIDTKEGLTAGVDVNGVLTGLQWRVLRKFTDESGAVLGESHVTVPLTVDELREHLGEALAKQAADIAQDRIVRDGIKAECEAVTKELREARAEIERIAGERDDARRERDEARAQRSEMAGRIAALERPQ